VLDAALTDFLSLSKGSVATLLSGPVPQAVKLKTKGQQNIKTEVIIYALAALTVSDRTQAQSHAGNAVPVTPDNFIRAESDRYFGKMVKDGSFGKFTHNRELTAIDKQLVVRSNRDTLNSTAVFDLDAGPVTITLPNAGKDFMSMQVIDEDMYTPQVIYNAGSYTFTRDQVGTRYVLLGVRILVDPTNPDDVKRVHKLQDAIEVNQQSPGGFEVANWDPASQNKVRDALLVLGTTVYRLNVKNVPVDGFWSISVYNAEGYYQPNELNAYSINNITAKKSEDGSITIQFGGCDGTIPNCLPIMKGWNYTVRLYRPRAEILNGTWTFPEAHLVN
jgi:hypothetical protein